ncbi:MAG TPA: Crp/Fnr family transcriptional regulator [Puia sp.]|nr:Crp/Fnr family transcriptional regulator [Puia sp.]
MKKATSCDLSTCFLCQRCLPEWKPALQAHRKDWQFKKGESIFREGEAVLGIYFVTSGTVKVHKHWGTEKEIILRFARKGDIFGHRGLGHDTLYPAAAATIQPVYPISATAIEPVTACFIDLAFFQASLKVNQEFMYGLLLFFASELQESERKMRNLAHMAVKGRVANALISLQEKFGQTTDGHIAISLSRQDLASLVGATYETVFRTINELSQENLIRADARLIRILDPRRLLSYTTE